MTQLQSSFPALAQFGRVHVLRTAALLSLVCIVVGRQGDPQDTPAQDPPAQGSTGQAGSAQGPGTRTPQAQSAREAMWPAPTAEDWAKPCLITWQRTYEDAEALSKETGKALLVCVNMDGEIASEHYAGIRYRSPEIAKLYEPYVTVMASVYRHNPRDFDEQGRRILCPRFGSVTCGEHIALEPVVYGKFLDETRVAPRHIGVELDGKEIYDIYYAFDTDSVFQTLEDGIANRLEPPLQPSRQDRPLLDRVGSPDTDDQKAVEEAFLQGDATLRRRILETALAKGDRAPVDLLRLAVFGFDLENAELARKSLAQTDSLKAVDLILESLRVPMEQEQREGLVGALERLGERSPRARTLAVVQRGLAQGSDSVDVESWSAALEDAERSRVERSRDVLSSRLDYAEERTTSLLEDPSAHLDLAEASLALAVEPETALSLAATPSTSRKYAQLLFEDARRSALKAEELDAQGWRVHAAVSLASFYLGDREEAHRRAALAVQDLPEDVQDWNAMAVFAIFAQARQKAIYDAVIAKENWPPEWLTDVHAAYGVLARHPMGADHHVVSHYDFLNWLGAFAQATRVLDQGMERFPNSWLLHDRLRGHILKDKGVAGLESTYEGMLAEVDAHPDLPWFAGYTSLVAAEYHRRSGAPEAAQGSYERAIQHYEQSILANEEIRPAADHYVAMALAGHARIDLEAGKLEDSCEGILAAFARKPEAAGSLDGLNLSAVATARTLRSRLIAAERGDLVSRLDLAMATLPPETLEPAEFDRPGANRGPVGFDGRPRRRNRDR